MNLTHNCARKKRKHYFLCVDLSGKFKSQGPVLKGSEEEEPHDSQLGLGSNAGVGISFIFQP
jgi:hypothetical protein